MRFCRSRSLRLQTQILAAQILAERLPDECADDEDGYHVDEHVRTVVQCRVDPRGSHGHVEKLLRHILRPNGSADDVVNEEAGRAGCDGAEEEAVFPAAEEACDAQDGVGQEVVADDGLPCDGDAAVEHELYRAVSKAGDGGRTEAPAHAEDDDRQHGKVKRAALRHFPNGQKAQDRCQSDEYRALAQSAESEVAFFHFYSS